MPVPLISVRYVHTRTGRMINVEFSTPCGVVTPYWFHQSLPQKDDWYIGLPGIEHLVGRTKPLDKDFDTIDNLLPLRERTISNPTRWLAALVRAAKKAGVLTYRCYKDND